MVMPRAELEAPDISCDHCIMTIEKAVTKVGARFISGDPETKIVILEYDTGSVELQAIEDAMEEEGYPVKK
jgi:copper chaperone CopZ